MTILLIVVAGGAALLGAGALYQVVGTAADRRRYPPPGRLIDVGGRRWHMIDRGAAFPTVVFESGISATCLNWTHVRADVERFARACTYDRAWLGWSDSGSTPRTTGNLVEELHRVLDAAGIARPCVFVGHSFGGMLVRAYAATYPSDVAGLVLIDPLSPSEWIDIAPSHARMLRLGERLARRGALLARLGIVRASLALLASGGRFIPKLIARASSGHGESVISRLVGEVRKMPPETWPMVRAHWCQAKSFQGMAAYLESLPSSAVEAQRLEAPPHIPITILSGAHSTPEQLAERAGMAGRCARGRHTVAPHSGHWVQLDQPDLVVEAIREMTLIVTAS